LELMKRLRKLEGIVEELSGQIEIETVRQPSSTGNSPEGMEGDTLGRAHNSGSSVAGSHRSQETAAPTSGPTATTPVRSSTFGLGPLKRSSDVHRQFGRLVLNEKGVTRYVSSVFWTSINDEVCDPYCQDRSELTCVSKLDEIRQETHDLTEDDSDEYDAETTPDSAAQEKYARDHQSFILGYRSADVDLRALHPLPSQIPFLWQVFQENVDPILKILHVPTMDTFIREIRKNMDSLTPSYEALMFSIYYASITSLDEEEVCSHTFIWIVPG